MPNSSKERRTSLTQKAIDAIHDVAEKTMELAHEVKEKISGHITEKDIANAGKRVVDLKAKLACEQHELKKIQLAAEVAENALELAEYEELKEKEQKTKIAERETEREIAEAEADYERLMMMQRSQKHAQMSHE